MNMTFKELYDLELEAVALNRRSGVPEDGLRFLVTSHLRGLVDHCGVDDNIAQDVLHALEARQAFC